VPARVSGLDLLDPLQVLEGGFEAPEAPARQGRHFALRHLHIPCLRPYEN